VNKHRAPIIFDTMEYQMLESHARKKKKSVGEVVRDFVRRGLQASSKHKRDPILGIVGLGKGHGDPRAGREHDKHLYGGKR
jgi:hypothetical protein